MKKLFVAAAFVFLFAQNLFAAPETAQISAKEASDWATQKGSEILNIVSEPLSSDKYQRLDNIMLNDVDLPYIARFVVGKYWKKMTHEQQEQYLEMFNRYILGVYKTFPLEFDSRAIKYKVEKVEPKKKSADIFMSVKIEGVTTSIDNPDSAIEVVFKVHRSGKKLKLIDMKIANSSLLQVYRTKFYDLILKDEEEMEWFLEDFELWIPNTDKDEE